MEELKVKQTIPHHPDCYALERYNNGTWDTPWAYHHETQLLDSIGRKHKHAHRRWHVYICNSTSCNALLFVLESSITIVAQSILNG